MRTTKAKFPSVGKTNSVAPGLTFGVVRHVIESGPTIVGPSDGYVRAVLDSSSTFMLVPAVGAGGVLVVRNASDVADVMMIGDGTDTIEGDNFYHIITPGQTKRFVDQTLGAWDEY